MLEAYTEILAILAAIAGVVMSLSVFPQVHKMYRRKSSADVSVAAYVLLLIGLIVWLLYGIAIENIPLILANVVGVFGAISVIVVYYRYEEVEK